MSERIANAARVIRTEADGLSALATLLETDAAASEAFSRAVDIVLCAQGHLIVVGLGKSGHIGQKLAASFASTGTPAFFMHPTEASHGDLGMVTPNSVVLAISNSGESRELVDVLYFCAKNAVPVIGITSKSDSTLGRASTVVLRLPDAPEACPNGLAPTTSTTNTLAMGDALVVATMVEKGVTCDDFGLRHPGGKLGRGLHSVADWLSLNPHDPPIIAADAPMNDVVVAMTEGQNGCVAVVDEDGAFVGMITDGDLRRAMGPDMFSRSAASIMTAEPFTASPQDRMADIIDTMTARRISTVFVVQDGGPTAVLNMKALMVQGYA